MCDLEVFHYYGRLLWQLFNLLCWVLASFSTCSQRARDKSVCPFTCQLISGIWSAGCARLGLHTLSKLRADLGMHTLARRLQPAERTCVPQIHLKHRSKWARPADPHPRPRLSTWQPQRQAARRAYRARPTAQCTPPQTRRASAAACTRTCWMPQSPLPQTLRPWLPTQERSCSGSLE